jgi:hypothetical protein
MDSTNCTSSFSAIAQGCRTKTTPNPKKPTNYKKTKKLRHENS